MIVGAVWPNNVPSGSGVLMRGNPLFTASSPQESDAAQSFIDVRVGDYVLVREGRHVPGMTDFDWWMGQVVFCDKALKGNNVNTMLQISDVDDGCIHWVKSDDVMHVVRSLDGLALNV